MKIFFFLIFFLHPFSFLLCQSVFLEKIAVYGNSYTRDEIIFQELKLTEGKAFTFEQLMNERAWLLRQNFFKRVEFQIKQGSSHQQRNLILIVQEKSRWSVSPILNNNDLFGWYTGAYFTSQNFWGRRNQIRLAAQMGGINHFAVSWENSRFGGKFQLFSEMAVDHTAFRYLYTDYANHFYLRETAFKFTLGKEINRQFKMGLRAGWEGIDVDDKGVTLSQTESDYLSLFEIFSVFDSRDWPLYPQTGLFLHVWSRWNGHKVHEGFQYFGFDMRSYFPVFKENILALQVTGALSHGSVPIYKRLHLGGSKTIRGYRTGYWVGENSLLGSLEYRFPIVYERNPLAGIHVGYAGVIFIDTGTAWFHGTAPEFSDFRGAAGFGIHVIWDHWVLRGEYGNHGKGWGFVIFGTGVKF